MMKTLKTLLLDQMNTDYGKVKTNQYHDWSTFGYLDSFGAEFRCWILKQQ